MPKFFLIFMRYLKYYYPNIFQFPLLKEQEDEKNTKWGHLGDPVS